MQFGALLRHQSGKKEKLVDSLVPGNQGSRLYNHVPPYTVHDCTSISCTCYTCALIAIIWLHILFLCLSPESVNKLISSS